MKRLSILLLLITAWRLDSFTITSFQPAGHQRPSLSLEMGKGDGKKKRKKKSAATTTSSTETASAPPPLRVSTDINIPIKRQIAWARLNQARNAAGTSFRQPKKTRTAYRKQLDEPAKSALLDLKKTRNGEPDWDVILSRGNGSARPLMMVDGYNVIHQWPLLKKHMKKGDTHQAREKLLHHLQQLSLNNQFRIECVFDGFGRQTSYFQGPGNEVKVSAQQRQATVTELGPGLRVAYSGVGASADSYIEKRCLDAKNVTEGKLTGNLIVVSNDQMIKLVASSAGALCMSSDRFVDQLKAVRKITKYRVEAAMAMVNNENKVTVDTSNINNSNNIGGSKSQSILMQGVKAAGMNNEVGLTEVDGVQVINTFRGGQFVIEDKRARRRKKKKVDLDDLEEEDLIKKVSGNRTEASIPSWAMLPDSYNHSRGDS